MSIALVLLSFSGCCWCLWGWAREATAHEKTKAELARAKKAAWTGEPEDPYWYRATSYWREAYESERRACQGLRRMLRAEIHLHSRPATIDELTGPTPRPTRGDGQ